MNVDIPRINYVLDVITDIEGSLKEISRANFESNKDKKEANLRRIEVVSEVIKNISDELKGKYLDVEWRKFAEIKNTFVNMYFGVDWDIVWSILKTDIPILKQQIEKIREEIGT